MRLLPIRFTQGRRHSLDRARDRFVPRNDASVLQKSGQNSTSGGLDLEQIIDIIIYVQFGACEAYR